MNDFEIGGARVLVGDCIARMNGLPDRSVQMCVTSPPYFGLRDYGHDGQIGLEETPDEFIAKLVAVFREVRRVLADDGTCWINIGDSYASGGRKTRDADGKLEQRGMDVRPADPVGIKQKDLIGIPWMLAFALRADGWYLRQEIIWHKPNPMPESVTDRCTKSHESLFLLSKSAKYFYDAEAVKEPSVYIGAPKPGKQAQTAYTGLAIHSGHLGEACSDGKRNRRSVWTVATRPYKGAHFATFPPALVHPCILAGSRTGDIVLDPFNGSGTTGQVALQHGRQYLGIELNADYAELTRTRLSGVIAEMDEAEAARIIATAPPPQIDMFAA